MNLINKIFAAFMAMMAIAIITAVIGWRTVEDLDEIMDDIIIYELAAEGKYGEIAALLQGLSVAQRTLLNTSLSPELRAEQRGIAVQRGEDLKTAAREMTVLLNQGIGDVEGWEVIEKKWGAFQHVLRGWNEAAVASLDKIGAWEKTTILNPDALLRDIQQYRGDHFQLASRLGEMISAKRDEGPVINSADNVCGFGRWRERFDGGQEAFSRNENLRRAMDAMTEPHRHFHQTAAEVQALVRSGVEENHDAIDAMFARHLEAARQVITAFGAITEEAERARALYADAEAFTMGELRRSRDGAIASLEALIADNNANMDRNFRMARDDGASGLATMRGLALFALGFGTLIVVYLYLTMRTQLTRPLTRVIASLSSDANEVAGGANDVAVSSASLSEGSTSQAAALEETSAAIEEITSTARRNLENSRQANHDMQDNARQIRESTDAVGRMSTAMGEIRDSSERIGAILKTIEDIAFQTNLLALNAAVEAARAGEAGKGFAVVADEVRNLAQRSAQAVKDTAELIAGTVDRVNNGVRITGEIERYFAQIAGTADTITRMIDEIDVATGEQTLGLEQINQSVSQIDRVNQENARHAETNARASVNLNDRSDNLIVQIGDLSGVLRTIVGDNGNGNGKVSAPMRPSAAVRGHAAEMARGKPMKALPAPKNLF